MSPGSDITYIYLFAGIGFLILVVASINFVTLSTARMTTRIREIGVRKAIGAHRPQLIGQFIGETMVLTAAAALLTAGMVTVAFPKFEVLLGRQIPLDIFTSAPVIVAFIRDCVYGGRLEPLRAFKAVRVPLPR